MPGSQCKQTDQKQYLPGNRFDPLKRPPFQQFLRRAVKIMKSAAVVKLISYRLYDSSSHFSTAMLEASRKYPRRVLPVINPRLEIVNNF